ncbi:hypothetical protein GJ496_002925 [Pomphorhynchus laevis]|nr:hypothetical protein GJ496_002925 [Pomphorhynchus laevis]
MNSFDIIFDEDLSEAINEVWEENDPTFMQASSSKFQYSYIKPDNLQDDSFLNFDPFDTVDISANIPFESTNFIGEIPCTQSSFKKLNIIPGPAGQLPDIPDFDDLQHSDKSQAILNYTALEETKKRHEELNRIDYVRDLYRLYKVLGFYLPGVLLPTIQFIRKKSIASNNSIIPLICVSVVSIETSFACSSSSLILTDGSENIEAVACLNFFDVSRDSIKSGSLLILKQVKPFHLECHTGRTQLYLYLSADNILLVLIGFRYKLQLRSYLGNSPGQALVEGPIRQPKEINEISNLGEDLQFELFNDEL